MVEHNGKLRLILMYVNNFIGKEGLKFIVLVQL